MNEIDDEGSFRDPRTGRLPAMVRFVTETRAARQRDVDGTLVADPALRPRGPSASVGVSRCRLDAAAEEPHE